MLRALVARLGGRDTGPGHQELGIAGAIHGSKEPWAPPNDAGEPPRVAGLQPRATQA